MTDSAGSSGAGGAPARDELPLPDYDHLPIGSLGSRIRSLDADGIDALLRYEREHGQRVPALQVLEARRDQLTSGSEPSSGSSDALRPEAAPPASTGSPVSPETGGPKINPPSHGVPTNPAQPRSTS